VFFILTIKARREIEMFLNKAIICGNVVRDPEMRYHVNTGDPWVSFAVATNRSWTDASGQKQESPEFHNVVVFGKQAEPCAHYLTKGQQVLVEGRLHTRSWEKDGQKHYQTQIIAERVQFGNRKQTQTTETSDAPSSDNGAPAAEVVANDDVPF
jgi:single-strand DNA-binding protein